MVEISPRSFILDCENKTAINAFEQYLLTFNTYTDP